MFGFEALVKVTDGEGNLLPPGRDNPGRHVAYAASVAANWGAWDAVLEARRHLRERLRSPRPYTLNAMAQLQRATKAKPESVVGFRMFAGKGTPAWKYLRHMEEGGARMAKRSEIALRAVGVLKPNEFTVPAEGGPIAARGNAQGVGSFYRSILTALKANTDRPYTVNPDYKPRRRRNAFIYFRAGNLIARRRGTGPIEPLLAVVRQPVYAKRLDLDGAIGRELDQRMPVHLDRAIELALRTGNQRGPVLPEAPDGGAGFAERFAAAPRAR